MLHAIARGEPPKLSFLCRTSWSSVRFDQEYGVQLHQPSNKQCSEDFQAKMTTVTFGWAPSIKKYALMVHLLSVIYRLVHTNTFCTKRDIYYQNPELFGSQRHLDEIVDDIACLLAVPRRSLHVTATSKGLIAGDLQYTEADGRFVDCNTTSSGILLTSNVDGITNMCSHAKFVLVVEKDATFQKLLDDNIFTQLGPCIIITGKGMPDVNSRLMVRKLADTLQLPTLALVDADPHGVEIMCVYKYGSKSMSFAARDLTLTSLRWLGVLPSDIHKLQIPETSLMPLSKTDLDKARDLMSRPYFSTQPDWIHQLKMMVASGKKAEIQALTAISASFLTDVYLPNKIRYGGWI
ncbi:PREDICTED: meiotic recombination protein SPO11-like isoform X2 [Priapulus caudatus]|nr:PREDICTED: meiotic recombination protein SPO11-like isoform X2 [Priapulus caudatus]